MSKRKPISKKTRFEVFKRDGFKCQYCGRSAPDAVLEVDHVIPVAKGGTNDILNLITSCRDCNNGKGARELSDDSVLQKQKAQLDELNEKREQMEMMIEWRKELLSISEAQVDAISEFITKLTFGKHNLTSTGRQKVKKMIKEFGFDEVYTATEITFDKYYLAYEDDEDEVASASYAFDKIGGVCYYRKKNVTYKDWKAIQDRKGRYGY